MTRIDRTQPRRSPLFSKRQLYFFVLWLPLLLHLVLLFYSAIVHVPFAIVHGFRARHKPTRDLLRDSWKVPFNVMTLAFAELAVIDVCDYATSQFKRTWDPGWGAFLVYPPLSFAAAALMVGLGWLLLKTLASRWPLDRKPAEDSAR